MRVKKMDTFDEGVEPDKEKILRLMSYKRY